MSWTSYFVQFGSVLFIFPLLIKVYTPLEQSFWWLLNTVIGLALLTDSGFGAVLMRGVAYFNTGADYLPRNKEEFEKKHNLLTFQPNVDKLADLLTTMKRVYSYLSLFMLLILLAVGPLILWNVMKLAHHRIDFWIAYLMLIPYCLMLITTARWRAFLRGLGFIAKEARINTNLGVLRLTAFFIILSFGLSSLYLVICMLAEAIVKYFFIKSLILKWFKANDKIISNKKYFDTEIFKSLWAATWKEGLIEWGNYLLASGNSIIMAQVTNLQLMADFLLTTRILNIIASVSQITLFSNMPKIYSFAAKNDIPKMKYTASGYMFTGLFIMIVSFLVVFFFGDKALSLLNKESQLVPIGILILMMVTQILDTHSTFHASIYISTNHIPFVIPSLVSGAIILGVGFLIMPVYGLIGIILLKFLVQLAFSNWYSMVLSLRLLKWPLKNYFLEFPSIGFQFMFEKVKSFFPHNTSNSK
jgi:O-antigen/teichoic acid export membrane protein